MINHSCFVSVHVTYVHMVRDHLNFITTEYISCVELTFLKTVKFVQFCGVHGTYVVVHCACAGNLLSSFMTLDDDLSDDGSDEHFLSGSSSLHQVELD